MGESDEEAFIRRTLAEVCALDPVALRADVPLIEYGLDSARAIDLLVAIEGEYDVRIPDDAVLKIRTLADLCAYVRGRVAAR